MTFPESSCCSAERPSPDLSHQHGGPVHPHHSRRGHGEPRPPSSCLNGHTGPTAGGLWGPYQPHQLPLAPPACCSSSVSPCPCVRYYQPTSQSAAATGADDDCCSSSLCRSSSHRPSSTHRHQGGESAVRAGAAGDGDTGWETGGGGKRRRKFWVFNKSLTETWC